MSDPAPHMVKSFEQDLLHLRDLITRMGGLVEQQVAYAAEAVLAHDEAAARRAVEDDPKVDGLEREIEQFVIRVLALRQPVAADLRAVVAALRTSGDLERVGDYAANIAKRSLVLNRLAPGFPLSGFAHMARLVQENLKLIIDAVGEQDQVRAEQVWRSDRLVDDVYTSLFRELITYMMEDPRNITACTHLMFIAKNMERIGDHATNIAENAYYAVTGESLPESRPKGDTTTGAYVAGRPGE